ncbi:hypothetical protein D9M71_690990 [compost metagenome]
MLKVVIEWLQISVSLDFIESHRGRGTWCNVLNFFDGDAMHHPRRRVYRHVVRDLFYNEFRRSSACEQVRCQRNYCCINDIVIDKMLFEHQQYFGRMNFGIDRVVKSIAQCPTFVLSQASLWFKVQDDGGNEQLLKILRGW